MTDADLKAMEARANAATPGPWRRERCIYTAREDVMTGSPEEPVCIASDMSNREDATFIAHARADVPALVDHVRALETALRHLEIITRRSGIVSDGEMHDLERAYGADSGWIEIVACVHDAARALLRGEKT